jgi:anaerobic magnesium-protoporphyrin IX monomethyl ester cyclase
MKNGFTHHKPNLLCIVPPYPITVPPASAAALLGYLKSKGCNEFEFLDLRLWVPQSYAITYSPIGVFGESFIIDVPDLPLVLSLLKAFETGGPLIGEFDEVMESYCLERGTNPGYLHSYLTCFDSYLTQIFNELGDLDLVGFTVWNSNYLQVLLAAAHLKRRAKPPFIVAGGPQMTESTNAAKLALQSGLVDLVALGEGEETLWSVYQALRRDQRTLSEPVAGTMRYDRDTGEFVSSKRPLLSIRELPIPDFAQIDITAYERAGNHLRVFPLQLSRGCTDKCSFCSEWKFWERFRSDDIEHVIDQVEKLKTDYGIDGIAFTDSLLNGVMPRLRAFAEGLLKRNINIKWGGFMRANMDRETAVLLRRAGCVLGFFGIESFDDETLREMNKRRTMADNVHALEAFLSAGIAVRAGFIPGFPGDTRSRFMKTAMVFRDLQKRFPSLLATGIEPFVVSPGQPIYQDLGRYGLTTTRWESQYLDIAPEYRPITEEIFCTVEGANQGIERAGQYQIAIAMSQDSLNGRRTQQHTLTQDSADFMHYSYNPEELETVFDLTIEHVFGNWYLGVFKTTTSLIYGCLLSHEEKALYQKLRAEQKLTRPWALTSSLLEQENMLPFLDQVESEHLIKSAREGPRIGWPTFTRDLRKLEPESHIAISPFVIARRCRTDATDEIVVMNVINKRYYTAPESLQPLIELLKQPRQVFEIRDFCEISQLGAWGDVLQTMNELKEIGMLVTKAPATVSEVLVQDTSQPLTRSLSLPVAT